LVDWQSSGQGSGNFLEGGKDGFFGNLLLELDEAVEESFGARGTAGNVDIDGEDAVDALEDGVGAVHAAGGGASAHGDNPFGFSHLVVDSADGEGHFIGDGAGDDHDVGLAGGEAHDFGAEAGDIEAGSAGGHEFDGAASEPHGHGPEAVFAEPVQSGVNAGDDDVTFDFRVVANFRPVLHNWVGGAGNGTAPES